MEAFFQSNLHFRLLILLHFHLPLFNLLPFPPALYYSTSSFSSPIHLLPLLLNLVIFFVPLLFFFLFLLCFPCFFSFSPLTLHTLPLHPSRDNDITGVLDHTFCVEHHAYGEIIQHELKPNGKSIPVSEETKKEYVR